MNYRILKTASSANSNVHAPAPIPHLDVPVDADGGIVDALQAFESHRTLLLVVDEEDNYPSREIQQDSDRGTFSDAAVRPARFTPTGKNRNKNE